MNHASGTVTVLDTEVIQVGDSIWQRAQRVRILAWAPLRLVRQAQRSRPGDDLLGQASALYVELGDADDLARVRSSLGVVGTRLCHWADADRPPFGWGSLTDTERRVTGLVCQGLGNRQVANQLLLSTHSVAFHLRHIF